MTTPMPNDLLRLAEVRPWGIYLVSAEGQVFSPLSGEWKPLRPTLTNGYRHITVKAEGRLRTRRICRIVCEAFHGPAPFSGAVVRHLDGSRANDTPANLAWGTVSENARDAVRHGTHSGPANGRKAAAKLIGEQSHFSRLTWPAVRRIRRLRHDGGQVEALASEYGVAGTTISSICHGKSWPEPGMILTIGVRHERGKSS